MLINDGKLNLAGFKRFYKKINWIKAHRKLSENKSDSFFIGTFEDSKKKIKVVIRPSMIMMLSESFKNMTEEGKKPDKSYKGKLCEFGTTIEVKIDDMFLDKIIELSKEHRNNETEKISWK